MKWFVPVGKLQKSETPGFPAPSPVCFPLKNSSAKHSFRLRPHGLANSLSSTDGSHSSSTIILSHPSFHPEKKNLFLCKLYSSVLHTFEYIISNKCDRKFSVKAAEFSNRLMWNTSHIFIAGPCFITDLCRDVHKLQLLLRNLSNCNYNQQDALKDWVWASLLRRCFC